MDVNIVAALRNTSRRWLGALLDGEYPWGAVITSPSRHGAFQQKLVVYPPGITTQDRRRLRVWRGWPLWGAVLWFITQVCLLEVTAPWTATFVAVGFSAVAGVAAFVLAGDARRRVRTLYACVLGPTAPPELRAGQRRLRLLAKTLVTAHELNRRGELPTVAYEGIWWHVYDAMAVPLAETSAEAGFEPGRA